MKVNIKSLKIKPVHIKVHPDFFNRMEDIRKAFEKNDGLSLSQIGLTKMLSKATIKLPTGRSINDKKQKRRRN